ncbi:CNH domain-containing protein [Cunninghamella echinulata]|nr:CNH domain-containing protein [Cunninghamella echinulata]
MYKYKDYFLLCYNDFAFLVDYKGCYSTKFYEKIDWIGTPHSVAFYDPYIIAFDHQLIEIRHVETGELVQVISGTTMQSLCLNPILTGVMTHPYDTDKQYVFELVPKN